MHLTILKQFSSIHTGMSTVGREIFTLKIIRAKNLRVVKFSWFCSIHRSSSRDFIFCVFNSRGWSRHEIIFTVKFSQSTVYRGMT